MCYDALEILICPECWTKIKKSRKISGINALNFKRINQPEKGRHPRRFFQRLASTGILKLLELGGW